MSAWMKWAIAILIGFGIIVLGFRFWGWVLSAFFVLNCVVLIIVVLLQSGKAADLAGEASDAAGEESCSGTARYTASGFAESEALIGLRIVFRIETDFRVLIDFVAVCGTIDSVMAAVASNG